MLRVWLSSTMNFLGATRAAFGGFPFWTRRGWEVASLGFVPAASAPLLGWFPHALEINLSAPAGPVTTSATLGFWVWYGRTVVFFRCDRGV